MTNKKLIFVLILSLLGFLDSLYLTLVHYSGGSVTCAIINGCDRVLKSNWAVIFGLPVALLGLIYYLLIACLSFYLFHFKSNKVLKIVFFLSLAAILFSLFLIYLQFLVIKALCFYCLVSATLAALIFISLVLMLKTKTPA